MTILGFPFGIDLHVHFREPGLTYKETMLTGVKAANSTGIFNVVDMPNSLPPADTIANVLVKKNLASRFKGIIVAGGFTNQSVQLAEVKKIASLTKILKVFLADSTGNLRVNWDNFEKGLIQLQDIKCLIMIHAEDPDFIVPRREGKNENFARPPEAEINAIKRIINTSNDFPDSNFHITHVSTAKGANLLVNQKKITWDVLPKHLTFNSSSVREMGNYAKMNPPLRDIKDQRHLFNMFQNEKIQFLTSDHAPHTHQDKLNFVAGAPGVQELYPFLIDHVIRNRITKDYAEKLLFTNPRDLLSSFNLSIIEGNFLVNDQETTIFVDKNILSKCGWSLWSDYVFMGKLKKIV